MAVRRLWRRKRRPDDLEAADAGEAAARAAEPVKSDDVPPEACTAIDCATIWERDGPDGTGQLIAMVPTLGAFEMASKDGVARRFAKAFPSMSEAACMKAARLLYGRARATRQARDMRPPRRRPTVQEMQAAHEIWNWD